MRALRANQRKLHAKRSKNSTICEKEVRLVSFAAGTEARQTVGYTGCGFGL
jgi:hypothetical protein